MSGARPVTAATRVAPLERDLAATAAVTIYSLAVAIGFARVFSGWEFLPDLLLLVLVGHGGSFVLRRLGVSGWIAIPLVTLVLGWVLAVYQYRSTLDWLIPWKTTWEQVQLDVGLVRDQFQTAVAPVIYEVGWATLAGLAMIIVIVMADAFAFRAEARGEALVPGGVLFVFIAALGSPRLRVTSTMLLVGAGVLTVVALRALHDRSRRIELVAGRRRASFVLPATVCTAGAIALLAGYVGPRLPGADSKPWYETRGRGGGITEVASPLVDIRSRLVNRGAVELFRVNADAVAYWRLTTLPEFDGRTFRLPQRRLTDLEPSDQPVAPEQRIRQQVQIIELGSKLLPAAAEPQAIDPNENVRYEADTGTLFKTSDLQPGEQYTIVSFIPDVSPDTLRATRAADPPDPVFLGLPDDMPEIVAQLAAEVTAGAATDYDKLIALQDWFRTFTYSTEVQSGHSESAIETFLQIRTGYCEQFSATFAAMSRTLGIPSRVAVGFTPGIQRDDGWFSVYGKNSHAWPEVWFDGVGWVAFEPTPGRGIPGATDYTGVEPEQDTSPIDTDGEVRDARPIPTAPSPAFPTPTTIRPRQPSQDPDATGTGANPQAPAAAQPAEGGSIPWTGLTVLLVLVAGALAPAVARRVRRRRVRHHDTHEQVTAAWQRARRSASCAGVEGSDAMTTREWASATAQQLPVAARPMASLAAAVDRIEFARPESLGSVRGDESVGRDCTLWASQVDQIASDRLSTGERLRRYFSDWS
jgi:transglutaminase-like putative cysteine protease